MKELKFCFVATLFFLSKFAHALPQEIIKEICSAASEYKNSPIHRKESSFEELTRDPFVLRQVSKAELEQLEPSQVSMLKEWLTQDASSFLMESDFLDPTKMFRKFNLYLISEFETRKAINKLFVDLISKKEIEDECVFTAYSEEVSDIKSIRELSESFAPTQELCQENDWIRLARIVKTYLSSNPKLEDDFWTRNLLDEFGNPNLKLLKELNIQLPIEKIEENFEKYGIIQLRPLKYDQLMLCCGNLPLQKGSNPFCSMGLKGTSQDQKDFNEYQLRHTHEDFDTVDIDTRMNPSVVGEFGTPSLYEFFADQGKKYRNVIPGEDFDCNWNVKPLVRSGGSITHMMCGKIISQEIVEN